MAVILKPGRASLGNWRAILGGALVLSHAAGVGEPMPVRVVRLMMALELASLAFADTGEALSGGNFHAEPVAFAADMIAMASCEVGSLAERRIAMLVDPALCGLPAFPTPRPGLNAGLMNAGGRRWSPVVAGRQPASGRRCPLAVRPSGAAGRRGVPIIRRCAAVC